MTTTKISFTIPNDTLELLKAEIPASKRSQYVAEKITIDLRRKKLAKILKETKGIFKIDGPKEWNTPESTRRWLRKMRDDDAKEVDKLWAQK